MRPKGIPLMYKNAHELVDRFATPNESSQSAMPKYFHAVVFVGLVFLCLVAHVLIFAVFLVFFVSTIVDRHIML